MWRLQKKQSAVFLACVSSCRTMREGSSSAVRSVGHLSPQCWREGEPQWRKKPDLHKLPPHSLNFTNKAKEQNISIFFLFFCPKSISIFKTTALCNRWTITHRQSKPGNIKTFSTFLVWCHFWRQCLSEITFTLYVSLRGHPRYHNAVMDRGGGATGKVASGGWGRWTVKTLPSSIHFQSYSILRGFCRERWCQAPLGQKAGYGTEEQVADLLIVVTGTCQHLEDLLSIQLIWVFIYLFKTNRF